ncbi:MAG TPA: trypsin-like peptidase domain-containing protein [Thermoanaerobaculia bacterium]|jgi:V8-like Glu-specific endopeptidase|nr:trypsin-like peptidase domain-containing protein [Thermoanaerobaculia bacterium]
MPWSQWTRVLNDVLADLYPTVDESKRIVKCAEMRPSLITFKDAALVNWFNILEAADKQGKKEQTILRCALADYPDHEILLALARNEPPVVKGPDLQWEAPDNGEHIEKITGAQSTLVPISFLEIGMQRSRAVARVVRQDRSSGTGFLIGGGWLLTNNHVLPTSESAIGAVAELNYQAAPDGTAAEIKSYPLDAACFHTSVKNDWTAIGIDAAAEKEWGTLALEPVTTEVDAFVNIIQHPGGGPKQIGLYHNTVAYVGKGRVQYLTDTLPGSSGSPVFDGDWKVVALHHSGGMLRQPGTKQSFYRNEGIAITTLIEELREAGVLR